jgi:hypothetical protein
MRTPCRPSVRYEKLIVCADAPLCLQWNSDWMASACIVCQHDHDADEKLLHRALPSTRFFLFQPCGEHDSLCTQRFEAAMAVSCIATADME